MQITHISNIQIPEGRQRAYFDPVAMQELQNSIASNGLLHPIVVRTGAEGMHLLVAGERRLRAITELFQLGGAFKCGERVFTAAEGLIPYTHMGELSEELAYEAELEENVRRKDLSWQELAQATQHLHSLRVKQSLLRADGDASKVHTVADTALEVHGRKDGAYHNKVRTELIVAQHLHKPEVAKAKSADEALKILRREEVRKQNIALAVSAGKTLTSETHELVQGSCLTWMEGKTEICDVILTDPPYGMDAQDFNDSAGRRAYGIDHIYDDSYESWKRLIEAWAKLSYIVAKAQAHAYVFCDIDRFHELKQYMRAAGWYVFRTPLIVVKLNNGRVPLPDCGPRRQYEIILYAIKGKKPVTHIYSDVISCPADDNLGHGAQKPVALFQNLLQRSVRPGDVVLDCFAGSGPIFPAAHAFKCKAIGIEQNPDYAGMCVKRLQLIKESDIV